MGLFSHQQWCIPRQYRPLVPKRWDFGHKAGLLFASMTGNRRVPQRPRGDNGLHPRSQPEHEDQQSQAQAKRRRRRRAAAVPRKARRSRSGPALGRRSTYAASNWVVGLVGGSSGESQSGSISNLSITAVASPAASNLLYPGGNGDVVVTISNPNAYPVTITAVQLPTDTTYHDRVHLERFEHDPVRLHCLHAERRDLELLDVHEWKLAHPHDSARRRS